MMRRFNGSPAAILAVVAIGAALMLGACSDSDAEPLPEDPHIRGAISELTANGGDTLGTALIEDIVEASTTYDAASVRIDGDTEIYRQSIEELTPAEFSDLEIGQLVEAWFTGPVAESYPVQAKAAKVVILVPTY